MILFLPAFCGGLGCYWLIGAGHTYLLRCRFYRQRPLAGLERKLEELKNQKKLQERLAQAGRPLGIRPIHYYGAHLLFPLGIWYFLGAAIPANNLIAAIVLSFFAPDIWLYSCRQDRRKAFKMDFPMLLETIELAMTADVPEEQAFLLAAENVQSKAMKNELASLSARLYATKDRPKALQVFSSRVGIPEAKILEMAICQGEKTGRVQGVLENITNSMFNTMMSIINAQEKATEYKIMAALFILLAGIVNLLFQAYFSDLSTGLTGIFG